MPCGCQSACGCDVVAGDGISVMRTGDTFTVTSQSAGALLGVTDTDSVDLTVSGSDLSADLRHQDTESVDLTVDAGGLKADVRIDPASTVVVTSSPAGLKFDDPSGEATTVQDTNTVDMTLSGVEISADVRYQDTDTVDLSDDASGLKADVRIDPASTADVSSNPNGLRIDAASSVIDTNSIDLTLAGPDLSANLRYQDTQSVDLGVDASGLYANVRIDPASELPISITPDGLFVSDTSQGQWITQVKTVNTTFTSLVEVDIPELLGIPALPNQVYEVQMLLITSSSNSSCGVRTRLNFPIGLGGSGHAISSPDNTYSSQHVRYGGPPISTNQNNTPAANETFLQRMIGIFDIGPTPGPGGNIRPQVKSETGDLVTVHRGSMFKWRRVL